MITRLERGHAFTHFNHHTRALMTEHRRENPLGIIAREGKRIGVTHAGMRDFYQYLALTRRFHIDLNDLQGFACFKSHSRT